MLNKTPHIRPLAPGQAPDPASTYERARPEKESGMGRLDNNVCVPARSADKMEHAVSNKQPLRQTNAEDVVNERDGFPADGESLNEDAAPRVASSDVDQDSP